MCCWSVFPSTSALLCVIALSSTVAIGNNISTEILTKLRQPRTATVCKTNRTIAKHQICNYVNDCGDNSDEQGCDNTYNCGLTCDKVRDQSTNVGACYCDVFCADLQDCCRDHKPSTTAIKSIKPYARCIRIDNQKKAGTWVISRCLSAFPDEDIKRKCENTRDSSVIGHLPVNGRLEDGRFYSFRNIYCAVCHRVNVSQILEDENFWTAMVNVPDHVIRQGDVDGSKLIDKTVQNLTGLALLQAVRNSSDMELIFKAPRFVHECDISVVPIAEAVKRCPKSAVKCASYFSPVIARTNVGLQIYANRHCAKCTNYDFTCIDIRHSISTPVSFAQLIDFTGLSKDLSTAINKVPCSTKQVYDEVASKCRPLVYPPPQNHVNLKPNQTNIVEVKIRLQISTNETERKLKLLFMSALPTSANVTYSRNFSEVNIAFATFNVPRFSLVENLLRNLLQSQDVNEFVEFRSVNAMCGLEYVFQTNCSRERISISTYTENINSRNGSHYLNATFSYHEKSLRYSDVLLEFSAKAPSIPQVNRSFDIAIHLCVNTSLPCPMTSYTVDEYEVSDNIVHINSSGLSFHPGEYLIRDNLLYVCNSFNNTLRIRSYEYSQAHHILSIVGCTISLCGLASFLLTYALFKELRTLAGKIMINLAMTLFMAQFLMLVSISAINIPTLCKVVAIAEHFLWLCAFFWMSIMCFCIFKTFCNARQIRPRSEHTIRRYFIFSVTCPLLIVVICLILEFATDVPFRYADETRCWISGNEAILFAFALPLAILICINIIFIVISVVQLIRSNRHVGKTLKIKRENSRILLIAAKLSTVMGATWIFGYVAALTGSQVFWYLFIILNSLQGLFMFLAYVLKESILRRYVKLMSCKKRGLDTDSQSATSKSSQSRMMSVTESTKL